MWGVCVCEHRYQSLGLPGAQTGRVMKLNQSHEVEKMRKDSLGRDKIIAITWKTGVCSTFGGIMSCEWSDVSGRVSDLPGADLGKDHGKVLSAEYPQYTSLPHLITLTIITENNNKCKISL